MWRPMDTAPKDETRFWGKVGDDAIAMLWHPKFEAFVSTWHRMTMAPGYTFNGEAEHDHSPVVHEPEGWMPLPDDTPDPRDTILAKMAEALKLARDAGLYFSEMESDAEMAKREAAEAKIRDALAEYEAWSGAKGETTP